MKFKKYVFLGLILIMSISGCKNPKRHSRLTVDQLIQSARNEAISIITSEINARLDEEEYVDVDFDFVGINESFFNEQFDLLFETLFPDDTSKLFDTKTVVDAFANILVLAINKFQKAAEKIEDEKTKRAYLEYVISNEEITGYKEEVISEFSKILETNHILDNNGYITSMDDAFSYMLEILINKDSLFCYLFNI